MFFLQHSKGLACCRRRRRGRGCPRARARASRPRVYTKRMNPTRRPNAKEALLMLSLFLSLSFSWFRSLCAD